MERIKVNHTNFCRFLKAKNPFGTLEGGDKDWIAYDDANTIFWCIKSLGAGGPDNGPIEPGRCVSGRSCYKSKN